MKAGYLAWKYILTILDVDLENLSFIKQGQFERNVQQVFMKELFGSAGEKENGFVPVLVKDRKVPTSRLRMYYFFTGKLLKRA